MSRLVKVNHVVLGLKLLPNSGGFSQEEIDELVNKRLAEGYDDVQITSVRTNFNDQGSPANLVQLYIFKKYEDGATASEIAQAILDTPVNESRGPGRPKKSDG